jgi:hypothetical protein
VTTNKFPTELQAGTSINVTEDQFFHGVNTQQLIAQQASPGSRFLQSYVCRLRSAPVGSALQLLVAA